ncbi:heme exporter protein CcmD [Gymnodinialimonas mytili]|uniref:heme exporter protein CcmD n=1 Tax=Gymnodinialimonas mytili TaxID=3126503 RepID=UPI003F70EF3F
MPDLGQYVVEVLSAYGVALLLLAALVIASVWRARRVAQQLTEVEARRSGKGTP